MSQLISIIMPAFNAAQTIQRAIDSVIAQNAFHELIIVDDASTDATTAIIEQNTFKHPKIKAFRLHENQGAAAARNFGVQQSAGNIIAFLDADDEHHPNFYAFATQVFNENPNLAGLKVGTEFRGFPEQFQNHAFEEKKHILLNTFIPNMMVRKICYEFLGGFPPHPVFRRDGGEDGVFCYLLSNLFAVGTYYQENFLIHHWHPKVHAEKFLNMNPESDAAKNSEVVTASWALIDQKLAALAPFKYLLNQPQNGFLPLTMYNQNPNQSQHQNQNQVESI